MKDGVKVFIKNESLGKYLFILRDNNPNIVEPNLWGLVGGGIEPKETLLKALKREVIEEVDIKIFDLKLIHQMKVKHNIKGIEYEGIGYYFIAKTKVSLGQVKLNEGQKASFFTLNEIKSKNNLCFAVKEILCNHRGLLE